MAVGRDTHERADVRCETSERGGEDADKLGKLQRGEGTGHKGDHRSWY